MKNKTEERLLERMEAKWNIFEDMSWSVKEACRWIHRETKKEILDKIDKMNLQLTDMQKDIIDFIDINTDLELANFIIEMNRLIIEHRKEIDKIFSEEELKKEIEGD